MNKLELLAPVGKMESLYAAVQNGANAVYLGGKLFNARHYASNFSNEELVEAVNYAHLRKVKVYVTVNILIDEEEMSSAIDYIKYLYNIGVDAVIVQDLGLAYLVKKLIPNMELHGSTQMTVNNLEGAKFLYDQGFARVVLSRETPLEEIRRISKNCPIELEVFIHGALCVSYSGQCLMSSMIGGRSGNRGRCAQPCRMPSSLIKPDGKTLGDWDKKHILSPKDLNTVEEIEDLVEAGVLSYKIEGRMKRPEYVATVVDIYRRALDLGSKSIGLKDEENIRQIFNRGFTKGLTFKDFGKDFISYDRPDNRGLYLGKVLRVKREKVEVRLDENLEVGDGIEFHLGQDTYKGMKSDSQGLAGDIVEFKKIGNIKEGDLVYRTSSFKLLEEAKKSYEEDKIKEKIRVEVNIRLGKCPDLRLIYGESQVLVRDDKPVEASKNKPLTGERVREQISKMGDTIYEIESMEVNIDEGVFMPVSSLNKLRREATNKLDKLILAQISRPELDEEKYRKEKSAIFNLTREKDFGDILSAKVESFETLQDLELDLLDRVYLNFYEEESIKDALEYLADDDLQVFIASEKILYAKDMEFLKEFLDRNKARIDGVSVSNLGTFGFIKENYDLLIHGDMGLNIFNSHSLEFLRQEGMTSCNLSVELNLKQIEKIIKKANMPVGVVAYGYIPVMTTKHCPMSLSKGCRDDSQCRTCEFRENYRLKDRVGAEFRLLRKTGFTNIYNSVPLMVLDDIKNIKLKDVNELRLDFIFEDERVGDILESYYGFLNEEISREEMRSFVEEIKDKGDITKGHFFRGIVE